MKSPQVLVKPPLYSTLAEPPEIPRSFIKPEDGLFKAPSVCANLLEFHEASYI